MAGNPLAMMDSVNVIVRLRGQDQDVQCQSMSRETITLVAIIGVNLGVHVFSIEATKKVRKPPLYQALKMIYFQYTCV